MGMPPEDGVASLNPNTGQIIAVLTRGELTALGAVETADGWVMPECATAAPSCLPFEPMTTAAASSRLSGGCEVSSDRAVLDCDFVATYGYYDPNTRSSRVVGTVDLRFVVDLFGSASRIAMRAYRTSGATLERVSVAGICNDDSSCEYRRAEDGPNSVDQPRIGGGFHERRINPSYRFSSSWIAANDEWTTGPIQTRQFRCQRPGRAEGCFY
jgi:hypothetical protein